MKFQNFRQRHPFGCGLYALANAIRDSSIVTESRLELSKNGNNIGQLNMWLIESGYEWFLEPLYFTSMGNKIPSDICEIKPYGDGVLGLPVLLDVQHSENSLMHMIAGEITTNGDLIVIDSLKDCEEITTLTQFNEQYFRCFGLWYFRDIYSGIMITNSK